MRATVLTGGLDPCPRGQAGYERANARLAAEFGTWLGASARGDVDPGSGEELLQCKWSYLDGHLTRWRRAGLDAVSCEPFPPKVIVEEEDLDEVILETKAFICFLAEVGYLDPEGDDPAVLLRHLDRIASRFRRRMTDPRRYSAAKRMWLSMGAEGIGPEGEEAARAWIEHFNARPAAERSALLGLSPSAAPIIAVGRSRCGGPRQAAAWKPSPSRRRR